MVNVIVPSCNSNTTDNVGDVKASEFSVSKVSLLFVCFPPTTAVVVMIYHRKLVGVTINTNNQTQPRVQKIKGDNSGFFFILCSSLKTVSDSK